MTETGKGRSGPLSGLRVIEFAGIGPAPFGAMLLADLGAEVIRIDRPGGYPPPDPSLDFETMGASAIFNRGRLTVRLDIKSEAGRNLALRLVTQAEALIEGYRPGTMEKLGLGPAACHTANPKLVYARMTGWGQDGPLAQMAGHDMNYLGVTGALSLFGIEGKPVPGIPPLVGDMGGGGLFMAFGLLAAVLEARQSGQGQVVDAAIVDGATSLYALLKALRMSGVYDGPAGTNSLDGGRYFYRTYACADGGHVVVGAIEPAFRAVLLDKLGLTSDPRFQSASQTDEPYRMARLGEIFLTKPRDHWAALFDGTDGCVTPLLSMEEAESHRHATARDAFISIDGVWQHVPAPRFSRTPGAVSVTPEEGSRHDPGALKVWGIGADEIARLRADGVID